MGASQIPMLAFYRDLLMAMISLAFGRLFPKLHPPRRDLTKKIAIVTGANSGIGWQIALELAKQNATVYLACRTPSKAEEAISAIIAQVPASSGRVKFLPLDTSSLNSVKHCANLWKETGSQIDILVHNAGIASSPKGQLFTEEGYPLIYNTNFLGSFLLTKLLEPYLTENARVIMTSSTGQYSGKISSSFALEPTQDHIEVGFHAPSSKFSTRDSALYSNSKLMQVCFAKLLQAHWDRLAISSGVPNRRIAHAFTPGFTFTPIFDKVTISKMKEDPVHYILRETSNWVATNVSQGAATGVWLASTDDENVVGERKGGAYWDRMQRRVAKADVIDWEKLERLWIRWEADAGVKWS